MCWLRTTALFTLAACGSSKPQDTAVQVGDTGSETDADTDTDTDSDTDTDTDTDSDTDTDMPPADPVAHLRIVHVATGHGPIDMFVNAAASPILNGLEYLDGTNWTDRPMGTYDLQFTPAGSTAADAIFELVGQQLFVDTYHTLLMYTATDGGLEVLAVVDDPSGIAPTDQRIRWTHTAPDLPPFDVLELSGGGLFVDDLAHGATFVGDYTAGPMRIGLDYNADGTADHEFEEFNLAQSAGPGTMVDIQVVSEDRVPFLIAYQPNGSIRRRDLVVPADTGDTGP